MAVNTVLKDEIRDILAALQLSATAAAGSQDDPAAFLQGYYLALKAVAVAFGLELPPRQAEGDWIPHIEAEAHEKV